MKLDFNDFMQLWCQLGATLGALGVHFWHTRVTLGHFGANSGAHWSHFGHLRTTLGNHEVTLVHFGITLGVLLTYEGDFGMTLGHFGMTLGSLGGHFGVTLRSLWCHFAHLGITSKSLWVYEGYFGVALVHFQKTFIFPIDFNDFIQLWDQLGVTLGSLGDHFAHSWVTLRSLWVYEVYFGVTLVHLHKTHIFPTDFNDFI